MRLDRLISSQTSLSRRAATEQIRAGNVTVGGVICRSPEHQTDPETDTVCLNGKPVAFAERHLLLLHKPTDVITAAWDISKKTVLDLLPPEQKLPGLMPVGRLDRDTAGLLLLTDDGQLAHRLISPKQHIVKYYLAQLRDPFDGACIARFREGITLREGAGEVRCLPAECEQTGTHTAVLAVTEGKYHQVRRMFAAAGNHVVNLLRVQIGGLRLPAHLLPGYAEFVLDKEQELLWKKSGISEVCAFCKREYSSYWIETGK